MKMHLESEEFSIKLLDNSWNEGTVTWNNAPAADPSSFATLGAVAAGNWYEVDVSSLVTGDGSFSLKIVSTSADGAYYASKEGTAGFAPQLVLITNAPTATPTPTTTLSVNTPTGTPTGSSTVVPTMTPTASQTPSPIASTTPSDTCGFVHTNSKCITLIHVNKYSTVTSTASPTPTGTATLAPLTLRLLPFQLSIQSFRMDSNQLVSRRGHPL